MSPAFSSSVVTKIALRRGRFKYSLTCCPLTSVSVVVPSLVVGVFVFADDVLSVEDVFSLLIWTNKFVAAVEFGSLHPLFSFLDCVDFFVDGVTGGDASSRRRVYFVVVVVVFAEVVSVEIRSASPCRRFVR